MTRRNWIRILAGAITGGTELLSASARKRPALTHNPVPEYLRNTVSRLSQPPLILHVDEDEGFRIHSQGVSAEAKAAILRHFSLPDYTPTCYVLRGYDPWDPRPVRRLEAHLVEFRTAPNGVLIKAYM